VRDVAGGAAQGELTFTPVFCPIGEPVAYVHASSSPRVPGPLGFPKDRRISCARTRVTACKNGCLRWSATRQNAGT
jgi:hypothetical protein